MPMHRYALPIALLLLTGCPTTEEQAADMFSEPQPFHEGGSFDVIQHRKDRRCPT